MWRWYLSPSAPISYSFHWPNQVFPSISDTPICCALNSAPIDCITECNIRTCASLITPPGPNCSTKCYPIHCHCAEGYYSNKCFQCVKEEECEDECSTPPIVCPGKNEELMGCYDPRKARVCDPSDQIYEQPTCSLMDSPYPLDLFDAFGWYDEPGESCIIQICDCKEGYKRNKCGICVEAADCCKDCQLTKDDECSDPNEIRYDEWHPCDARTCQSLKNPIECVEDWNNVYHNRCDCKEDYYRDSCGRCIAEDECENQEPCKCTNPCGLIKNSL